MYIYIYIRSSNVCSFVELQCVFVPSPHDDQTLLLFHAGNVSEFRRRHLDRYLIRSCCCGCCCSGITELVTKELLPICCNSIAAGVVVVVVVVVAIVEVAAFVQIRPVLPAKVVPYPQHHREFVLVILCLAGKVLFVSLWIADGG